MHPELFRIGPIPVRSYGLMLAASFLLGVWYIKKVTERDGKPFEPFLTISYIMIFGGVIGARLAYVLLHLSEFSGNWTAVFNPFQSGHFGIAGLNLYGGILMAIGGSWLYCHLKGLRVLDVFDYFAPTVGLGIALTRIGCFLNGCCFGVPCDLPWAVTFPKGSIPYSVFGSQPLHPAQLYSSLYGLVLFIGLHYLLKHKRFVGQAVAVLFMGEAFFRFIIEYARFYENAMTFRFMGIEPTYNQVVSLTLFFLGLGIYWYQKRQGHPLPEADPEKSLQKNSPTSG
jgi:phosphatidylglycerol:prolipoprotein diacylglycerol transferase